MIYFPKASYKSKAEIASRLNRERRYNRCKEGNRNPFLNSRTYYAAIRSDDTGAEEACALVRNAVGDRPITEKEIKYVVDKNSKLVNRRWLECGAEASRLLGSGWHVNAYIVLQQVLLFAYKTGLCSAAQGVIGKAVGLSRKAVNKWIKRFCECGVLEKIGYDCRGVAMNQWGKPLFWKGKPIIKYCLILAIVDRARLPGEGYTTPKAMGSGVGSSSKSPQFIVLCLWILSLMLSKIARARQSASRIRRWVHSKRFK